MDPQDIPESRTYRHLQCDQETNVSGQPFEVISNPLSDMTRTWCNHCDSFFPLSDYEWADTGENITEYYSRHSASATQLQRFLCSKRFLIILVVVGFILGAVAGFLLFRNDALWLKIVMTPACGFFGVFGAAAVYVSVICNMVVRKVCGVSDTRVLK
ncbi:MAG: ammonium transporter [Planctomycetes bacterium]|nr:ammonium transporter [Planctomycetota bacterium]